MPLGIWTGGESCVNPMFSHSVAAQFHCGVGKHLMVSVGPKVISLGGLMFRANVEQLFLFRGHLGGHPKGFRVEAQGMEEGIPSCTATWKIPAVSSIKSSQALTMHQHWRVSLKSQV